MLPGKPFVGSVTFSSPDTGWASTGRILYRTTDKGVTWSPWGSIYGNTSDSAYGNVHFVTSKIGFSASGFRTNFIARTDDGGLRWYSNSIHPQIDGFANSWKFLSPDTGFVLGNHEIARTTNCASFGVQEVEGGEFRDIAFLTPKDYIAVGGVYHQIEPFEHDRAALVVTHDGGATWGQVEPYNGANGLSGIARLSDTKAAAVGEAGDLGVGGLILTADQGKTWRRMRVDTNSLVSLHYLAFADSLHGIVVNAHGWMYRTSDGGETWRDVSLGWQGDYLRAVAMPDTSTIIIVGGSGMIFRWVGDSEAVKSQEEKTSFQVRVVQEEGGRYDFAYLLPYASEVQLRLSDLNGRIVSEPLNEFQEAGAHQCAVPPLPSGTYLYTLSTKRDTATGKFRVIK